MASESEREGPCACDETYGAFTRRPRKYAQCRRCGAYWVAGEVRGMVTHGGASGDHPDHPPVEGGYRGVLLRLPDDSAERKRIPLASGLLDYFPEAVADAINNLDSGYGWECSANAILTYLAQRDYTSLFCACLDALQDELVGPPTQCRSRDVVERWGAALIAVAQVSVYGNEKHNPGEPLHHARGKSMDHADCIARHTFDAGGFDGPMRHSACRAWRAGALAQEAAEAEGAPLARGARLPEGGAK